MTPRIGKRSITMLITVIVVPIGSSFAQRQTQSNHALLLQPDNSEMNRRAPATFRVRLETTKGVMAIELHRSGSPHGVDRFYNLVAHGYYDNSALFRIVAGKWAQFGINGDPTISQTW